MYEFTKKCIFEDEIPIHYSDGSIGYIKNGVLYDYDGMASSRSMLIEDIKPIKDDKITEALNLFTKIYWNRIEELVRKSHED